MTKQSIRQSRKKATRPKTAVQLAHPGGSSERYTPEQVKTALREARGMIAIAARTLGCTRKTVYDYKTRHPDIVEVLEDAKELQLDTTELKLFQAITNGEAWAICFYLKCHARERGYIERHDVKVNGKIEGGVLYMPLPTHSPAEWAKQFEHAKKEHTA